MVCVNFHTFFVVLTLIHSCRGQSEVICPFNSVVTDDTRDAILECYLHPATDVSSMTVEWTRPDLNHTYIHVWPERAEEQNPSYRGRTSLFIKELKHGKIFLKISNVKMSDEGTYTCSVPELGRNSTTKLVQIYSMSADASDPPVNIFLITGVLAVILIFAVALFAWKRTQGKFKKVKKETRGGDGPEERREEKMIYSKKDNGVFQIMTEGGESETLMTGSEETQDQHVPETGLIEDMERPEGEKIIPSIIIEKDSQFITSQEMDEKKEMSRRKGNAEGGEGERTTESGKDYLGICLLPLREEHKEQLMSGKSGSMDWLINFHLDQKTCREEQQEHVLKERRTESDPDIKQLSTEKKRKKKNQVNDFYSRFVAQKRQQENQRRQLEAEQQRKLQSETGMEGEKDETEIKMQKDKDKQHHTDQKQEESEEEPDDEERKE